MKSSEIKKAIKNYECPTFCLCSVDNIYYNQPEEKQHRCLLCWLDYCKKNEIKIEYDYW